MRWGQLRNPLAISLKRPRVTAKPLKLLRKEWKPTIGMSLGWIGKPPFKTRR